MRTSALLLVAAAAALGGCLDSVVGGRCADGWIAEGDVCRPLPGGEIVAGPCDLCPSGLCQEGVCIGQTAGHVVLIGHDYRVHTAAAARVLGNAAALTAQPTVRVTKIFESVDDTQNIAVDRALDAGLTAAGRTWTAIASDVGAGQVASVDVVLVLPRPAPAATSFADGARWRAALTAFVAGGGTVIGLEGPDSSTIEFLRGAALLDVTRGSPATGDEVSISVPTDALTVGVPSPYLAARGSMTFATTDDAVAVATSGGAPIVLHAAWPR